MTTTRWTAEAHPPNRKPSANVTATALIHHVCRIICLMVCPPWSEHLLLDERRRLDVWLLSLAHEGRNHPDHRCPARPGSTAEAAVKEPALGHQFVDSGATGLMA